MVCFFDPVCAPPRVWICRFSVPRACARARQGSDGRFGGSWHYCRSNEGWRRRLASAAGWRLALAVPLWPAAYSCPLGLSTPPSPSPLITPFSYHATPSLLIPYFQSPHLPAWPSSRLKSRFVESYRCWAIIFPAPLFWHFVGDRRLPCFVLLLPPARLDGGDMNDKWAGPMVDLRRYLLSPIFPVCVDETSATRTIPIRSGPLDQLCRNCVWCEVLELPVLSHSPTTILRLCWHSSEQCVVLSGVLLPLITIHLYNVVCPYHLCCFYVSLSNLCALPFSV